MPSTSNSNPNPRRAPVQALSELAAAYRYDPLGWAEVAFPWGEGELANSALRNWQCEVLGIIRDHLASPETRFRPLRIARASGHGIGKSSLLAMVANWAMTCHAGARVLVTANTENQLRTKTSPEFAKWFRLSVSRNLFSIETLRIACNSGSFRERWRVDFVPWSEHNTEAFAGLHNVGRIIVLIMDEASAIADNVWEVAEGALTDEQTIILWLAFGNPTRNTGRFRECFRRYRSMWNVGHIDAREVEGTNKELLAEWANVYGEDSDFFRVRVRGQFPSASTMQFIPTDLVEAAAGRHLRPEQYRFAPVVLACDPAWTGDDELVIVKRQGLYAEILDVMPKNDNDVWVAQKLAMYETQHKASAVFVDAGYGTGIVSAGTVMGRRWHLVWGSGKPVDPGYLNRRAEMWRDMREWLRAGGAIPNDPRLIEDLIGPEILPRLDGKVALESKVEMRRRGLPSPDRADALALTFAFPVFREELSSPLNAPYPVVDTTEFDPWR